MKNSINAFTQARTVIETIHGEFPFGVVVFNREEGTNHAWPVENYYGEIIAQAERFKGYYDKKLEPFLLVGCSDDEGYANKDIKRSWAIALDFDDGLPPMLSQNELVSPTLLVETSPGRYQGVWVLTKLCSTEDYNRLVKSMAHRLGSDLAHAKVSQLLRLPGFFHGRHGTCSRLMDESKPEKAFELEFLECAFDIGLVSRSMRRDVPRLSPSLEVKHQGNAKAEVLADAKNATRFLASFADDYMPWLTTLMAFASLGDEGKPLAKEFSSLSNKFKNEDFEQKWQSVLKSPGSVSVIFARAQQNGWKNPGFRGLAEKRLEVLTERDLARLIAADLDGIYTALDKGNDSKLVYEVFNWDGLRFKTINKITIN